MTPPRPWGGKIAASIPENRIPRKVLDAELQRINKIVPHVHLQQALKQEDVLGLIEDYDFVVIAAGAQKPRSLPIPGRERMVTALDFLRQAKAGNAKVGETGGDYRCRQCGLRRGRRGGPVRSQRHCSARCPATGLIRQRTPGSRKGGRHIPLAGFYPGRHRPGRAAGQW